MTATDHDAEPNALQAAIRARALATLENAERQPKPSRKDRIVVAALTLLAVLSILFIIDITIRVMHHILIIWYGDPATEQVQPAPQFDPSKPYYITVDPPASSGAASSASVSSATH